MLPKIFKPIFLENNSLIRIGPKYDGGYILNKKLIENIDTLITFGLSDEWDFEKDLAKKNKNLKIFAFDHTVNDKFWIERLKKDLLHFVLLKKLRLKKIINMFKFFHYKNFFNNKNRFHIQKKIGLTKNDYDLNFIISNFLKKEKNFLLKIDIEGDEYNILSQILINEQYIDGLLIEFHNLDQKNNKEKISDFINKLKNLKLIHIHSNNYALPDKNGDPTVLEMTFSNLKYIENYEIHNPKTYPIQNLDVKNRQRLPDVPLNFES